MDMNEKDQPEHSGQSEEDAKSIEQIITEDGRYHPEAFGFLHEGLSRAVGAVHDEPQGPGHHVLRRWGIRESIDFGNMVYLLIQHGLMRKTDEDSIEDFRDVFDLDRDFDTSADIRLKEE